MTATNLLFPLVILAITLKIAIGQTDQYVNLAANPAVAIDFIYDSQKVVYASTLHYIRVIDSSTSTEASNFLTDHKDKMSSISVSPDGLKVLTGGRDFKAFVY